MLVTNILKRLIICSLLLLLASLRHIKHAIGIINAIGWGRLVVRGSPPSKSTPFLQIFVLFLFLFFFFCFLWGVCGNAATLIDYAHWPTGVCNVMFLAFPKQPNPKLCSHLARALINIEINRTLINRNTFEYRYGGMSVW